jgi:hypothetical protein
LLVAVVAVLGMAVLVGEVAVLEDIELLQDLP